LFSTNDSSQVALPDVFRQQILSLRREHEMLSRWDQTMNMVYPAAQFIVAACTLCLSEWLRSALPLLQLTRNAG
jgi:hypothetical protein